jgi:hypothetical protein
MTKTAPKSGNLPITLATWMYLLAERGHVPLDPELRAALDALSVGVQRETADLEGLGRSLVGAVALKVGEDTSFDAVHRLALGLYGEERVDSSLGAGSRDLRARNARRYQFSHNLPWIACIIDRFPDGQVGAHWVMVEQVTDVVKIMDPYPWDDVDEETNMPVVDFMVKWELAGANSLRLS